MVHSHALEHTALVSAARRWAVVPLVAQGCESAEHKLYWVLLLPFRPLRQL